MAKQKKHIVVRIVTSPIFLHALIIIGVFIILIFITLFALDKYTRHNESVTVPTVKGFQVGDAGNVLRTKGLLYEISDSVYSSESVPGSVIDQVPKEGSQVKKGRTIYLTIKAKGREMVTIPSLVDYSRRQAEAQLYALGFTKITISEVPSRYKGLVIRIEYQGQEIQPGQKIPKGEPLRMVIGGGGSSVDEDTPQPEVDQSFFE